MKKKLFVIIISLLFNLMISSEKSYSFHCDGKNFELTLDLSEDTYNFYKNRTRNREIDLFVSDTFDDREIKKIVSELQKALKENSLSRDDIPYVVMSFVQSFVYCTDISATGQEDYPKFPYETLYDSQGDCEDLSILVASLLKELGFGVVLLSFPEHMAVGVYANLKNGKYYNYKCKKYYYFETTDKNWKLGEIPDKHKNETPEIIEIEKRVFFDLNYETSYEYNDKSIKITFDIKITNTGSIDYRTTYFNIYIYDEYGLLLKKMKTDYLSIDQEERLSLTYQIPEFNNPARFRAKVAVYSNFNQILEVGTEMIDSRF